jgi:diaminopimelate epimerase
LEFSKYHGLRNDFLLVYEEEVTPTLAQFMCDRYAGIGADGVIQISKSPTADFSFVLFNADGSLAEVSGNGLRCVGKFLYDRGLHKENQIKVEAGGEVKILYLDVSNGKVESVRVDMGVPTEEGEIELFGRVWKKISTGNPHAVTFVDDIEEAPVTELGPQVENHPEFPNRTNVEFVQRVDDGLKVRFWERGVGVTNASGTGSSAAAVAGGQPKTLVHTPGGDLVIEREESGRLFMSGPAVHVFDGTLP